MENITTDGNNEAADLALVAADGQCVEQRLGRMLMRTIAGIDHRAINFARQEMDRASGVMADHNQIWPHGVQCHRRVDERLALFDRGRADRHVHDVGAKPFARELEGGLRPGRGLEEQIDLSAAAKRRLLLLDLTGDGDRLLRETQQDLDVRRRQALDAQKMAVRKKGGARSAH